MTTFKKGKGTVTYDSIGLSKLRKILENKKLPKVRVGILGDENSRSEDEITNAEIGARHELGLGVPVRSFLRMPIINNFKGELEKSGFFDNNNALDEVLKSASFTPLFEKMAVIAENVVSDSFNTGGDGQWPESDMSKKKNHQTLVETQQLRNSITSEVEE